MMRNCWMNTTRNLQSVCCCEFYIMFDIQLLLVLDLPKIFCHVGFSINGTKSADHPGGLSIVNLSSLGHWLEKPTGWVVYNGKSMSVKQFSMFPLFTVKSKPIFHLWNPPCCSLFEIHSRRRIRPWSPKSCRQCDMSRRHLVGRHRVNRHLKIWR